MAFITPSFISSANFDLPGGLADGFFLYSTEKTTTDQPLRALNNDYLIATSR